MERPQLAGNCCLPATFFLMNCPVALHLSDYSQQLSLVIANKAWRHLICIPIANH